MIKIVKNYKRGSAALLGVYLISALLSACNTAGTKSARGIQNPGYQQQRYGTSSTPGITTIPGQEGVITGTPLPGQGRMVIVTPGSTMGAYPGTSANQPITGQQVAADRLRADNIRNQVKSMKEVTDCNVAVMGNTALVGCTPATNADVNTVKTMISNKIKETDKSITNVVVTEKPDIMNSIKSLGSDITNNRPMSEITNMFNQIKNGITPAVR